MLENELKFRLSGQEDWTRISQALGQFREERQLNVYFDTEDLSFHRQGILLRLRYLEADQPVFTVKRAETIGRDMIIAEEEEKKLSPQEAEALVSDPGRFLASFPLPLLAEVLTGQKAGPLLQVAKLRNERRIFSGPWGELVLDRTDFPGGPEYEIELETDDLASGRQFLQDLFGRLGIQAQECAEPKSERLFRALGLLGD